MGFLISNESSSSEDSVATVNCGEIIDKVAKSNYSVSTAPDDRAAIVDYSDNNISPVYTEDNVELIESEFASSQMR